MVTREELGKELFYFLHQKGVSPATVKRTVGKWTSGEMGDFLSECDDFVRHAATPDTETSAFDFVAPLDMSGAPWPCASISCRMARGDQLARFSALYADHLRMCSPLPVHPPENMNDEVRIQFAENVHFLYYFEPLIRAGIVSLEPNSTRMCAKHILEYKQVKKKMHRAAMSIVKPYLTDIKLSKRTYGEVTLIKMTGPEQIIEHGVTTWMAPTDHLLARLPKAGFVARHVEPTVANLMFQNACVEKYSSSYLVTGELDQSLIQNLNDTDVDFESRALLEGFSHQLPFVVDVDIQTLIKLRQTEADSFQVYRDALNDSLRIVGKAGTSGQIRELFNDEVRPELNKIQLAVNNSKRAVSGSVKRDLTIAATLVSLGLFSGVLPPESGQILAGLGGYKFVSGVANQISELMGTPNDARNSKYFFLWKAQQLSKKSL